jgi:hypothetical protein
MGGGGELPYYGRCRYVKMTRFSMLEIISICKLLTICSLSLVVFYSLEPRTPCPIYEGLLTIEASGECLGGGIDALEYLR